MKKQVDDFIKNHKYINYCEAIIYKDGYIEYASPSHVEALIKITGESRDAIYDKMPVTASPIIWLIEYTGCIAVYTNGCIKPKICTEEQEIALKELLDSKLLTSYSFR